MLHLLGNESMNLSTGLWIAQAEKRGMDAGLNKRLSKIEVGTPVGDPPESGPALAFGCRPGTLGLLLCNAHRENDVPKHLFAIAGLDLSGDLCVERLAGQWFRLGAWTLDSGSDGQGMENVVYRQSMLLSPGDFDGFCRSPNPATLFVLRP
jgi:hypothetical protein